MTGHNRVTQGPHRDTSWASPILHAMAAMITVHSVIDDLEPGPTGLRHSITMPTAAHNVARPPAMCPAKTAAQ